MSRNNPPPQKKNLLSVSRNDNRVERFHVHFSRWTYRHGHGSFSSLAYGVRLSRLWSLKEVIVIFISSPDFQEHRKTIVGGARSIWNAKTRIHTVLLETLIATVELAAHLLQRVRGLRGRCVKLMINQELSLEALIREDDSDCNNYLTGSTSNREEEEALKPVSFLRHPPWC